MTWIQRSSRSRVSAVLFSVVAACGVCILGEARPAAATLSDVRLARVFGSDENPEGCSLAPDDTICTGGSDYCEDGSGDNSMDPTQFPSGCAATVIRGTGARIWIPGDSDLNSQEIKYTSTPCTWEWGCNENLFGFIEYYCGDCVESEENVCCRECTSSGVYDPDPVDSARCQDP